MPLTKPRQNSLAGNKTASQRLVKCNQRDGLEISLKQSRDGISDKLSVLIKAIRDSSDKKIEEREKRSTGNELRRLFP